MNLEECTCAYDCTVYSIKKSILYLQKYAPIFNARIEVPPKFLCIYLHYLLWYNSMGTFIQYQPTKTNSVVWLHIVPRSPLSLNMKSSRDSNIKSDCLLDAKSLEINGALRNIYLFMKIYMLSKESVLVCRAASFRPKQTVCLRRYQSCNPLLQVKHKY